MMLLWMYSAAFSVNRTVRGSGRKRERKKMRTDPESLVWLSLHPHELNDALRPHRHQTPSPTSLWLPPSPSPTPLSLAAPSPSLNLHTHSLTCCMIQEPCSSENKKNVKHKTHILYIHGGHAWPSTASPEAKHVKGYLCSSKDPWRLLHTLSSCL